MNGNDLNGMTIFTKGELQELQDKFSAASGVYTICFGKTTGVLTSFSGTKKDRKILEQVIGKNYYYNVLRQIRQCDDAEEVYVGDTKYPFVKVAGVNVIVDGVNIASWIITAIIEDDIPEEDRELVKHFSRSTTRDVFYKSIDFLHIVSRKIFQAQYINQKNRLNQVADYFTADRVNQEKRQNTTITKLVQLLENDKPLNEILSEALSTVGKYLEISDALALEIDNEHNTANLCAEWNNHGIKSQKKKINNTPISELLYVGRYPCIISSNMNVSDYFENFMGRNELQAFISFPIIIEDKLVLSLVFQEKRTQRVWDTDTIKFLFNVKRIIQSLVMKKMTVSSLETSYTAIELMLDSMGCGIFICDKSDDRLLYVNQKLKAEFSKAFEDNSFIDLFKRCAKDNNDANYMELFYTEENRWYEIHYSPIIWVDGKEASLCTAYDITDRKVYQKKIEHQANNDFLTGLYNRMRCESDLAEAIDDAISAGGQGALIYIDLDDFKSINDDLGHTYGDSLLRTISYELRGIEGVGNNFYRMGGDEFIGIISYEHFANRNRIIEEIRERFSKPWYLDDTDCYCTMSMGVTIFPQEGTTVLEIMKKADIALYEAKRHGKNCVEYYNKSTGSSSYKRLDLEKNMRRAVGNACGEFEVYYQPVFDMQRPVGNKCCGAEALIRWKSEQLGMIPPSEFIPLAEYLGLINPIGEYVLEKACMDCKSWNDRGYDFKVNVNLSVVQLLQNDIEETIHDIIIRTGINPKNLTLEVTESLAINDMERMKNILSRLRLLGVRIALDDFGTGYSSLNHIKEIPLDVIKVDQCFIKGINEDEFAHAFVKMVTELAAAIGVTVCVEGVENIEVQKVLRGMNVKLHQGYFYDLSLIHI